MVGSDALIGIEDMPGNLYRVAFLVAKIDMDRAGFGG